MALWLVVAVALLSLGVVTIFSIGLYLIFLSLAMFSVVWALRHRPWIALGTVAGAAVAIPVHFLTAPLSCSAVVVSSQGGSVTERAACDRILLPDLQSLDVAGANWFALAMALTAGIVVGLVVARLSRRVA
jgi:hypothetical protein